MTLTNTVIAKKKFLPGIAWFFIVLILICIPGYDLPETDNWLQQIHFDKLVHIGIFGLLSYLFQLPVESSQLPLSRRNNWVAGILICTILYGITTEAIQHFFIPGRSFDLGDWAADSIGAALSTIIILIRRKQRKQV